ncbi:transposase [Sedimenticola hydrogenitrophicus]|uniref:transposase n=1 Tax=Sedimenticola hydrogenitrophicus TaxID=2967975 RepID=UPI0021A64EC7|nr:transposase [Sedimenticola hydrogenitrophicus]
MPRPRKTLVSLDDTPYYHCVSRCVRRAFLCGEDHQSGRSFEHRRGWIEERLLALSQCFAIDICGYAVMSNHTHLVLFVDSDQALNWSIQEIIERWHGLFSGTLLSQRYLRGDRLSLAEVKCVEADAEQWRERLMSISWFMRCLNEPIARLANTEDNCSGRFWEGRFKCQALLDEAALAACLAYVDLNPVRAGLAETPEASDHTSVQRRIRAITAADEDTPPQPPELMPFVGNPRQDMPKGLAYRLEDYLSLVDWTGRQFREDKRGRIPETLSPILQRLAIDADAWLLLAKGFEVHFNHLVGRPDDMQRACVSRGQCWAHGIGAARRLFSP